MAKENLRKMPSIKKYTADETYHDIIYGYLQTSSIWDMHTNRRYVDKKSATNEILGEIAHISRQTAAKKMKGLIQSGLVEYDGEARRYYLPEVGEFEGTLVPYDTLSYLVAACSQDAISIYVYLLRLAIKNKKQGFSVYYSDLKDFVGLSNSTRSNNKIIWSIMHMLGCIGLVHFKLVQKDPYHKLMVISKVNTHVVERTDFTDED